MFGIGLPELIIIMAVALIVVGPDKLPELAKSLGRGIVELKKAASGLKDSLEEEEDDTPGWDPQDKDNPPNKLLEEAYNSLPEEAMPEENDADVSTNAATEEISQAESDEADTVTSTATEEISQAEPDEADTVTNTETEEISQAESDEADTVTSTETEEISQAEPDEADTVTSTESEAISQAESDEADTVTSTETEEINQAEPDEAEKESQENKSST